MSDTTLKMWPIKVGMRVTAAQEATRRGLIGHPVAAVFTVKSLPSQSPGWFEDENDDPHYIPNYVLAEPAPMHRPNLDKDSRAALVGEDVILNVPARPQFVDPLPAELTGINLHGNPVRGVLDERGRTHGDFTDHARITQRLKDVVRMELINCGKDPKGADMGASLTPTQQEAIDMILHKIGRIIAGNPNVKDHWLDLAGYSTLVADRLP